MHRLANGIEGLGGRSAGKSLFGFYFYYFTRERGNNAVRQQIVGSFLSLRKLVCWCFLVKLQNAFSVLPIYLLLLTI